MGGGVGLDHLGGGAGQAPLLGSDHHLSRGQLVDLSVFGKPLGLEAGIAQVEGGLVHRDDAGGGDGIEVIALIALPLALECAVLLQLHANGVGYQGTVQMLGDLRPHLAGVSVNGLLAAEDDVKGPLVFLLQRLDGGGDDLGGGQGIRAAEDPVCDEVRLVSAHSQTLPQGVLGLGDAHGDDRHLAARLILQAEGDLQSVGIKGIDDGRHALTDEGMLHRVDFNLGGVRHLLDADQNVQRLAGDRSRFGRFCHGSGGLGGFRLLGGGEGGLLCRLGVVGILLLQLAGDDGALDLVGALVDLKDLGIPHQLLHGVVLHVAVAAHDLNAVHGALHAGVGAEGLGNGGLHGKGQALVHQLSCVEVHLPGGLDLNLHIRQHDLHRLEVGDGLTELLALLGVLRGLLNDSLADADAKCAHARTGVVQGLHDILKATVFLAQKVVLGDADVVKDDLRGAA